MVDPVLNDLAYEYVLGNLSEIELTSFVGELERNPELRALVHSYQEIATGQALTVPQLRPPLSVKKAIKEALPYAPSKQILYFPTFFALAAAAACLAFLVREDFREQRLERQVAELTNKNSLKDGVISLQKQRFSDEISKEDRLETQMAELAQQQSQMWSMEGSNIDLREMGHLAGRKSTKEQVLVAWNRAAGEGLVETKNVSVPPKAHDYQLWILAPNKKPISAGVVVIAATGPEQYRFHATLEDTDPATLGFAISLEPSGGSAQPTGPILFLATPRKI